MCQKGDRRTRPVSLWRRLSRTAHTAALGRQLSKFFSDNILTSRSDVRPMGTPSAFSSGAGGGNKSRSTRSNLFCRLGRTLSAVPRGHELIMAEIAIKRAPLPGLATREKLRTLDDGAVVAAFLGGEERAFQEIV